MVRSDDSRGPGYLMLWLTSGETEFCNCRMHFTQLSYIHLVFLSLVCGLAPGIPVTVWTSRCIYFTTSTSYYCLYQLTLHWRTSVCDSQYSKEPHLYFAAGSIPLHLQLCLCFPLPLPSCTFICVKWCAIKRYWWRKWCGRVGDIHQLAHKQRNE